MASSAQGTSSKLPTQTQPNHLQEDRDQFRRAGRVRRLNSRWGSVNKPSEPLHGNSVTYAAYNGDLDDDETAALQYRYFLGSKGSRRTRSIILQGNRGQEKYWETCFPANSAVSSCAEEPGDADVRTMADRDICSEMASTGGDGEKACTGGWPISRLAADDRNMGTTGALDVATRSIRDGPTMASGANSGHFLRTSENEVDVQSDCMPSLPQPTDHAAATGCNLDVASEAEAAIPGYGLWMKLVQGS